MPRLLSGAHLGPLLLAGLVVSGPGCSHRCPTGTTPRGNSPPRGRAQWCEAGPKASNALPAPGRTFEATLDMQFHTPKSFDSRNLRGPMTTWFENGEVQSHGNYEANQSSGSAPHGLWTVFYETGEIRSQGNFLMGDAVGCFSFWDKDGSQYSATWSAEDEHFQGTDCEGPSGALPATLRASLGQSYGNDEVLGDVGFQTFLTTGGFGVANHEFLVEEPTLSHNGEFSFRRYLDEVRVGGRLGLRTSDDGDHQSGLATATLTYVLPKLSDSLDLEVGGALGVQVTEAIVSDPQNPNNRSPRPLRFAELYSALETTASWRFHDYAELVATARLEGGIPRSRHFETILCNANGCPNPAIDSTWDVGQYSVGLAVGVRFLLR